MSREHVLCFIAKSTSQFAIFVFIAKSGVILTQTSQTFSQTDKV